MTQQRVVSRGSRDDSILFGVTFRIFLAACALFGVVLCPSSSAQECFGDCNRDGTVTIEEPITAVGIAFGQKPIAQCRAADVNASGGISIDEIVVAVNRALFGCPVLVHLSVDMSPDPARPGQVAPVFITIGNTSAFDANNVVIEADIPLEFASFPTAQTLGGGLCGTGGCDPGEVITWSVATLRAHSAVTVGMYPSIASGAAAPPDGRVIRLVARARRGVRRIATDEASLMVEADPVLGLALTMLSGPVGAGDLLVYALDFGNRSTGTLSQDVRLRMPLPPGTLVVASDGGELVGDAVEWPLGNLLPGQGGSRRLTVRADETLPDGALLPANASLRDAAGNDAFAATSTRLESAVPLRLVLELNPNPLRPGEQLETVMTVTNTGLVPLPDVVVETKLPAEFDPFSPGLPTAGVQCAGGINGNCEPRERVSWNLGTLAAGGGMTVRMPPILGATTRPGTVIRFDAFARDGLGSSTRAEAAVVVDGEPVLELGLAAEPGTPQAGELLTYRLHFGNSSAATLSENVRLRMPLPVGTTFVAASDGGVLVNGTVEWQLGTFLPGLGGSRTLTVRVGGTLPDGALLVAEASVEDAAANRTFSQTSARAESDVPLQLTVELNPDPLRPGEQLEAVMTVTNTGAVALLDVVVETVLPREFDTFLLGLPTTGVACAGGINGNCEPRERVFWNLGSLPAGSGLTVRMPPELGTAVRPGTVIPFEFSARDGAGRNRRIQANLVVDNDPVLELALSAEASPVPAGATLIYQLHFGNNSTATISEDVHLRMPVPAGTTLVAASDGGVLVDGVVVWDLATLGLGEGGQRELTVEVDPALVNGSLVVANASVEDGAGDRTFARTSSQVESDFPLHLAAELNPDPLRPGEQMEMVLTVTNTGPVSLLGVVVETALPPEFDAVSPGLPTAGVMCAGGINGNCEQRERVFWNLGAVAAGSGVSVRMPPRLGTAVRPGTVIPFDVFARDSAGRNRRIQAGLVVDSDPVLELALSAESGPVEAVHDLTYRLHFGNSSTATIAENVLLRIPVPAGTEFVSVSDGGVLVSGVVEWNLGTLGLGEGGQRELTINVDQTLVNGSLLAAVASVEDDAGNRTFSRTSTRVESDFPLHLAAELNADPLRPGEQLEAVLTVTNTGPVNLLGVVVETALPPEFDPFPPSLATVGVMCAGGINGNCEARERVFWNLGTVPAGGGVSVRMPPRLGTAARPGTVIPFDVFAMDGTGGNRRIQTGLVVDADPVLELDLSAEFSPVEAGEVLTYRLHFGNSSPSTLSEDVRLRVPLPVGATFVAASDGGVVVDDAVEWDLGAVGLGDGGRREVMVQVDGGLVDGALIVAEASIDDAAGNRTFSQTSTHVESGVPLMLSLSLTPDPLLPGGQMVVEMTVANTGPVPLPGVVVETALPPEFDAFAPSQATAGVGCAGGINGNCEPRERVFWNLGMLAVGGEATLRMPPRLGAAVPTGSVIPFGAFARDDTGSNLRAQAGLGVGAEAVP